MLDIVHLHPMIVHFPIALLSIGLLLDILGVMLKREEYLIAGKWNIILGTFALVFVVATGLLAEDVVEHTEAAHEVLSLHKRLGVSVLVLFAMLGIWRFAAGGWFPIRFGKVFLLLSIFGVVIMSYGAFLGGKLVYEYGLAVSSIRLDGEEHPEGEGHEHSSDSHDH